MTNPLIKRGSIRTTVGVEVSELSISLLISSDTTLANVPAAQFIRQGGLDGARLSVARRFYARWGGDMCGSLNLFNGKIGPLTISGSEVQMSVKSDLEILDVMMPRNIYLGGCIHTVYDSGCNLSAAAFTVAGNVSTASALNISTNLAQADGYFDLGVMKVTSGTNNQVQRSVRLYAGGNITPMQPFPSTLSPGTTFTIRPGCDKTELKCDGVFSNKGNYRGYPFIPAPETTY